MKTIGDIVEACQSGERPDYDDLRLTVCALHSLMMFEWGDVCHAARRPELFSHEQVQELIFERRKRVMAQTPAHFLGDRHPDNPGQQQWRAMAQRIYAKATARQESKE